MGVESFNGVDELKRRELYHSLVGRLLEKEYKPCCIVDNPTYVNGTGSENGPLEYGRLFKKGTEPNERYVLVVFPGADVRTFKENSINEILDKISQELQKKDSTFDLSKYYASNSNKKLDILIPVCETQGRKHYTGIHVHADGKSVDFYDSFSRLYLPKNTDHISGYRFYLMPRSMTARDSRTAAKKLSGYPNICYLYKNTVGDVIAVLPGGGYRGECKFYGQAKQDVNRLSFPKSGEQAAEIVLQPNLISYISTWHAKPAAYEHNFYFDRQWSYPEHLAVNAVCNFLNINPKNTKIHHQGDQMNLSDCGHYTIENLMISIGESRSVSFLARHRKKIGLVVGALVFGAAAATTIVLTGGIALPIWASVCIGVGFAVGGGVAGVLVAEMCDEPRWGDMIKNNREGYKKYEEENSKKKQKPKPTDTYTRAKKTLLDAQRLNKDSNPIPQNQLINEKLEKKDNKFPKESILIIDESDQSDDQDDKWNGGGAFIDKDGFTLIANVPETDKDGFIVITDPPNQNNITTSLK